MIIKSSLPRPVKELKGFKKINLQAGEEQQISFTINKDALSFYDDKAGEWVAEPGRFEALVGASAGDVRSRIGFDLK